MYPLLYCIVDDVLCVKVAIRNAAQRGSIACALYSSALERSRAQQSEYSIAA
jgi:hypothetical protein